MLVAKLDRLSRDVHFISGLMAQRVPFIVAELGADADPFMLHIYAALAEKERGADRRAHPRSAGAEKGTGGDVGNRTNLADATPRARTRTGMPPVLRGQRAAGRAADPGGWGEATPCHRRGTERARLGTARGGEWHATTVRNLMTRDVPDR